MSTVKSGVVSLKHVLRRSSHDALQTVLQAVQDELAQRQSLSTALREPSGLWQRLEPKFSGAGEAYASADARRTKQLHTASLYDRDATITPATVPGCGDVRFACLCLSHAQVQLTLAPNTNINVVGAAECDDCAEERANAIDLARAADFAAILEVEFEATVHTDEVAA